MHNQLVKTMIAPVFVASLVTAASAGPALVTYRFGSMNGNFDLFNNGEEQGPQGGFLAVTAVSNDTHVTSGDMTRLDHRPGTSEFNPGFASVSPFSVSFAIEVTNFEGPNALGNGTLTMTDADGDVLTADLSGVFGQVGNSLVFNGVSDNYGFSGSSDSFDGVNGEIMIDDLIGQLYAGAVSFQIAAPTGLAESFSDTTTNVLGQFVPSPAGIIPLIAGFGLATRRRR